ncbi:hypothetical protein Elgi_66680 [Paenibacillus elgii]|uniref:hypothetical protein n=1 Tax=Paenibacillus elgii TaxID=189691 RepID=UPI002D7C30AC|nr:hypothetical protein Elgi_66680 [Paenibacillus elgii]
MAKRTNGKNLNTDDELIVQKLKETFDRHGINKTEGANVGVMAAAAITFDVNKQTLSIEPTGHPRLRPS